MEIDASLALLAMTGWIRLDEKGVENGEKV
jgi:hypothetical protein